MFPRVLAASLGISLLALGCAKTETIEDRQLAEMREQMTKLENERDRADERLSALEINVADENRERRATPLAAPIQPAHVVQVGDPADTDTADPNDKDDRPDIHVTGNAVTSSTRGMGARGGKQRGGDPVLDLDAKPAYDAALALVQQKQYDRGVEALSAFLVRFPDHPYAENAMYWRGEAYFAQGNYARASEEFDGVLARFGSGKKAPDALLKLGMCQERLGAPAKAREYYDRLKNDYPRSDAAKHIPLPGAGAAPKGPKENR